MVKQDVTGSSVPRGVEAPQSALFPHHSTREPFSVPHPCEHLLQRLWSWPLTLGTWVWGHVRPSGRLEGHPGEGPHAAWW